MEGTANSNKMLSLNLTPRSGSGPTDDFVLRKLSFSITSLQNDMVYEIVRSVALKLKECNCASDGLFMVNLGEKLLPFLSDAEFTPLWIQLLDGLFAMRNAAVADIYNCIREKLPRMFHEDSLPLPLLHHLWLSDLPSVECTVLALVRYVCSCPFTSCPSQILDVLEKCHLAEIARREPAIYHIVYDMLETIASANGSNTVVDIMALFCETVRKKLGPDKHRMMQHKTPLVGLDNFASFLTSDPTTVTSPAAIPTLQNLHKMWLNTEKTLCLPAHTSSVDLDSYEFTENLKKAVNPETQDRLYEELWHLTVQHRQWVSVAFNSILSCDSKAVPSCEWIIAAYHRLRLDSSNCEKIKLHLNHFISLLRKLSNTSDLAAELPILGEIMKEDMRQPLSGQSSMEGQHDKCHTIKKRLMMAYLFHSAAGFSVGQQLLALVTDTANAMEQILCFIYHYQTLNPRSDSWTLSKRALLKVFIGDLIHQLKEEADIGIKNNRQKLQEELEKISVRLKT